MNHFPLKFAIVTIGVCVCVLGIFAMLDNAGTPANAAQLTALEKRVEAAEQASLQSIEGFAKLLKDYSADLANVEKGRIEAVRMIDEFADDYAKTASHAFDLEILIVELQRDVEAYCKVLKRNSSLVLGDHVAREPYEGHRQEHLLSVELRC